MSREKYTVLIPYPLGKGHYSIKGEIRELLDVEAHALRAAGRIELYVEPVVDAEAAAATTKKAAKAATEGAQ